MWTSVQFFKKRKTLSTQLVTFQLKT